MSAPTLPVLSYKDKILQTVSDNPVTIVVADTGAGKTTQVPQFLLSLFAMVYVTQPRVVAARNMAMRVAFELGAKIGTLVGYQTGPSSKRNKATRCLFITDALALGLLRKMTKGMVLVVDEAHEQNRNITMTLAYAKYLLERGAEFKLVVMSATLESEALSRYFDGAPVINVPGRLYPIEERQPGPSLEADVIQLLQQGRNVLVFQPGVKEIRACIAKLKATGVKAVFVELHGTQTPEKQEAAFKTYADPLCVVATNVAQTSITIDGIDAVVDGGTENRVEIEYGIEGLKHRAISLADRAQRKGRAGRTRPGIYIDHCPPNLAKQRTAHPVAEILRTKLEGLVLSIAEIGVDAEELSYFPQPDPAAIPQAKRTLRMLSCLDEPGQVTDTGKKTADLPFGVVNARIAVEANRLGITDDGIVIAAILEQGGITDLRNDSWKALVPDHHGSDVIAHLLLLGQALRMTNDQRMDHGINPKAVEQVIRKCMEVKGVTQKEDLKLDIKGDVTKIVQAVCAGMIDNLYKRTTASGVYKRPTDPQFRNPTRTSVVTAGLWAVGIPFDIGDRAHLLQMVTVVKDLGTLASLYTTKTGLNPHYNHDEGEVYSTTEVWLGEHLLERIIVRDPDHPEAARLRNRRADRAQWERWLARSVKPRVNPPNPANPHAVMPSVLTGKVPNTSLTAYGLPVYNPEWRERNEPPFMARWTHDRTQAEQWYQEAAQKLRELKDEFHAN